MAKNKLFILAISLALTLPVASATWFSQGTMEPDTDCDTSTGCVVGGNPVEGGYMYSDPDVSADGTQIYLNGYFTYSLTGVNPNSEITGSKVNPNPEMSLHAFFGVWKDCNKDGYIGAGNGALHTYSTSVIAPDTVVCPDGSQFNRNGWVYEFIWIGHGGHREGDESTDYDGRWINDTQSLVWADFGRPGSAPGSTCPLASFPPGTFASTGGMIRWVDCITNRQIVGTVNTVDADGELGLRFDSEDQPQTTDSLLNQDTVNLFGDPYSGPGNDQYETGLLERDSQKNRPNDYDPETDYDPENADKAFHVWDCSQPEFIAVASPAGDDIDVEDPSGGPLDEAVASTFNGINDDNEDGVLLTVATADERGNVVYIAAVGPGVDNPTGSYYDALNHTERGMASPRNVGNVGLKDEKGNGNVGPSNCDETNETNVQAYGGVETRAVAPAGAVKRTADEWFSFDLGGGAPRGNLIFDDNDRALIKNVTGEDVPHEGDQLNATLGTGYTLMTGYRGVVILRPSWDGFHIWTTNQHTVRDDGSPGPGSYTTFYARFGSVTTGTGATTPRANAASLYGAEWCKGKTSGLSEFVRGVDCDATHWWDPNPPFFAEDMPKADSDIPIGAVVHDPYHLRDVDCVDGSLVRGVPVFASLVQLSEGGPCKDA